MVSISKKIAFADICGHGAEAQCGTIRTDGEDAGYVWYWIIGTRGSCW